MVFSFIAGLAVAGLMQYAHLDVWHAVLIAGLITAPLAVAGEASA